MDMNSFSKDDLSELSEDEDLAGTGTSIGIARDKNTDKDETEVIKAHLQLIEPEVDKQKIVRKGLLSTKFEQSRREIDRIVNQNRRRNDDTGSPLGVFPAEIWCMILKNLESADVQNCLKVHLVFNNILEEYKVQWLFGKIFPNVINFLTKKKEVLNCRLICKWWRLGVDKTLENFNSQHWHKDDRFLANVLHKELVLKRKFVYKFAIPDRPTEEVEAASDRHKGLISVRKNRENMKLHQTSPFIGQAVVVQWNKLYESRVYPEQQENSTSQFINIFYDFGPKIMSLHLTTYCHRDQMLDINQVFTQCLEKCSNLKSLKIVEWFSQSTQNIVPILPNHGHLQSLAFESCENVQNVFVRKYSNQLKTLTVIWNPETYHEFEWANLEELAVAESATSETINSLMLTNAPNLRSLDIKLNEFSSNFVNVLQMLNHFPKLEFFKIKPELNRDPNLSSCFNTAEYRSADDKTCLWSKFVTTLYWKSTLEYSFNFLVLFPFLKKLIIEYSLDQHESIDDELWGVLDYPDIYGKSYEEFVQVGKYIENDDCSMYESNVWEIMPTLQKIELVESSFRNFGWQEKTILPRIYTREEYNKRKFYEN